VAPPAGAIAPDHDAGEFGFDFTRFGLRVPAVLVSPLLAGVTVPVAAEPGPAAGQPSHLQEVQAELVSRQFPAGVSPAPGKTGPAPVTDAALASYIRAHA
jgi:hypothetical protein